MALTDEFLRLKQEINSISSNPLLNCFEQDELNILDQECVNDTFIAEKRRNILNLVQDIKNIDFNPKLKSSYDEYSEALTYLRLKRKFLIVNRIPENKIKTPDFKIEFMWDNNGGQTESTVYAELKSMSFADGNLNYRKAMKQSLSAQIDIEEQFKKGRNVAFGVTEVQPLFKDNGKYSPTSVKFAIETLIEKIEQNLKEEQFAMGETVLIIDLKQLSLPSYFIEGGVPIFQEQTYNSNVSGVQWNTAFGKIGHLVYKAIEFEGRENIEGELEREGILVSRDWIKAIIFLDYTLSERHPKIVGLHKQRNTSDAIQAFLNEFCDFINDDKNTGGWQLNDESPL